ncbi:MAG: hypothetical protein Kow0098_15510 [Ignavibacteriaceae bacterium]
MKGIIVSEPVNSETNQHSNKTFKKLVLNLLLAGLYGFFIFFTVLLLIEFLTGLFESNHSFVVNIFEMQLSIIGFMGGLIVKLFETKVKKNKPSDSY